MTFADQIKEIASYISFQDIRKVAIRNLPPIQAEQDKLFDELLRGKAVIADEPHMNMYLKSYGNMHKAKLQYALDKFQHALDKKAIFDKLFTDEVEVFDWGCGQGIATLCLLDKIKNNEIQNPNIKRITLVEPSTVAIERAKLLVTSYDICKDAEIRLVNKGFDDLVEDDVRSLNCRKVHLFSNILDVTAFDLAVFTQLFQKTQKGGNYIVCVGPYYSEQTRVDWFIEAINPDYRYVSEDFAKCEWINEWTLSLRIVAGFVQDVEDIAAIRKRIDDIQKTKQFFAGYVADAVSDTLSESDYASKAEELMSFLSVFEVKSNKSLVHQEEIDSKLAVLSNIISRGLPTRAPKIVEEMLAKHFSFSQIPVVDPVEYHYARTENCKAKDFFEALHVIYPGLSLEKYNINILESSFENDFIKTYLPNNEKVYLSQVLEPQRSLNSILSDPNKRDKRLRDDQRVDFSLEVPYSTVSSNKHVGFVLEINGEQYHSSVVSRIKDARRESSITNQNWGAYSLRSLDEVSFSDSIEEDDRYSDYLNILKENYKKEFNAERKNLLQFVLVPFAIARIEKILIEAIISGYLKLDADVWKIAVIERDVPCAALAIRDFTDMYKSICKLVGNDQDLPEIDLQIISTADFKDSPLHDNKQVRTNQQIPKQFDVCIDTSILLREGISDFEISIESDTYYVIRTAHHFKDKRRIYCSENISYQPLVEKTSHGEFVNIPERQGFLEYFLQNIFRKRAFREGQLPILSRVLTDKTTIGLLPTGGGKSLTYQLPVLLQPGVAIVVDPLVSLMVDQYNGLVNNRIDVAACLNSNMDRQEKMFHIGRMQNGEIQFMLLSPERFMMKTDFRDEIVTMAHRNKVYFSYGVIDEVHTVSEWGHDFRPAYLQLGKNMTSYMQTKSGEDISIIGLTATASFDVLADVERELTLGNLMSLDSDAIVRPELSERDELTYHIVPVKANFTQLQKMWNPYLLDANKWSLRDAVFNAKEQIIDTLFRTIPEDIDKINGTCKENNHINAYDSKEFYNPQDSIYPNAGIIFCPYREGTYGVKDKVTPWRIIPGVASIVEKLNPSLKVGTFIGGDHPNDMDDFKHNRQNLMVATKAFGMGIDKPNVRYTINITHPSSIESFVQEAGRAGRDKKVAISYLLYESTEYVKLSVENLSDMFGQTLPNFFNNLKDKYILASDIRNCFRTENVPEDIIDGYEEHLSKKKQNADRDIQLFFHNSSFKGAEKEKSVMYELTYNPWNTLSEGVYNALNRLKDGEYAEIVVEDENIYKTNSANFANIVLNEINNIGNVQGWIVPRQGQLNLSKIDGIVDLLEEISRVTNDTNWRTYYKDSCFLPLKRAFYRRRDKDDTDKAIYRMCCVGLVDDVIIQKYVSIGNQLHPIYTLIVRKHPEEHYFDTLRKFFEKYYSKEQAERKVNEAREHSGNCAADKCMGYLAEFIYQNLEVKRKRAIDDMREACENGISRGDEYLKEYIHLYFNSKYARENYEVDGKNCSLKKDIEEDVFSFDLLWKYIDVLNNDPSGTEIDNVKHLYGAVLIILRAQPDDAVINPILFLLRSFCLAFLGMGVNETLIFEFKNGYLENGWQAIIDRADADISSTLIENLEKYNSIIKEKAEEKSAAYISNFISATKQKLLLGLTKHLYSKFEVEYLK